MAGDADSQRFDAVVIGAGPGGEWAAIRLSKQGLKTALVERELVGGECAYWACIPSKTLLRPAEVRLEAGRVAGTAEPAQRWREIAEYRDYMIRNLDDKDEIESYQKRGIAVFKAAGRLAGPGQVDVGGQTLTAERIVLATGSAPQIPELPGLEQAGYWTNREATTFRDVPESVVVLGGGPVGIELAQLFRRFGAEVELVEAADRLLAREDAQVGELVRDALQADGIGVHLDAQATSVEGRNGEQVEVALGDGGRLQAQRLVVAIGRRPRIDDLGLDRVGIDAPESGIKIDERCRAADGVWALGDVTGVSPFTHVAKYQARIVVNDICGNPARADYSAVPRVVFCDPEVAAVGVTEAEATEQGIPVVAGHVELGATIARPVTYETDPRGELCVLADRDRRVLVGAWAVAPLAGEWIHYAALAIKAQIPLDVLRDTVLQFPTYTEGYLSALDGLEA